MAILGDASLDESVPIPKLDIELAFLEDYLIPRNLDPYLVQEQAFGPIFAGDSVVVTVPTGTGKTLMAKAALFKALRTGQRAVYTTPLRALTEQKYRELCEELGAEHVGFATGDFKVNRGAPIQVEVAEILWNRIFGDRTAGIDVVIMDEGHYFNDPGRGYVWEQSIIGLQPNVQLIILSATVGSASQFCTWVKQVRGVPMKLVESHERRVPLHHQYRESYLIEVARHLAYHGDVPAIVFVFGRERCFETARLLKSCRRFTTNEEREKIAALCDDVLLAGGAAGELRPLLLHGIGIHHAGILPRYRRLVEELAEDRLIKFIVSTETIAAGINLPAKCVLFSSLSKYTDKKSRMLTSAEFHQMAGRAGRPQFDTHGIAIVLAPEEAVSALRKEIKDAEKGRYQIDEAKLRKGVYGRLRAEATRKGNVLWDADSHNLLISGQPAGLCSQTRITPSQVLAIGLADQSDRLSIQAVVDRLLLPENERVEAKKRLGQVIDNLRAIGIVDEDGAQVEGDIISNIIKELRGMDGLFVYYALSNYEFDYQGARAMVEWLVEHDVIQRVLARRAAQRRREWILNRLRERRREGANVTWEDIEEEYERSFPWEQTRIEQIHSEFRARLIHPQLHPSGVVKSIWATIEDEQLDFHAYVSREQLAREEGSLFSYLVRVASFAAKLSQVTGSQEFADIAQRVRDLLSPIDSRLSSIQQD